MLALITGHIVLWVTWKDLVNVPFSHQSKE